MTVIEFLFRFNQYVLNPIILLLFAVALLYFVYGVVRFLSIDASEKGNSREESRNAIFWGIVGMIVMFSVYALIAIVLNTFGISSGDVGPGSQFIRFK
jgi:uncharacterized membrane protein YidH (DUF202 family)